MKIHGKQRRRPWLRLRSHAASLKQLRCSLKATYPVPVYLIRQTKQPYVDP
ncbi:hypothetical protein IF2G_00686 [Cordyceps javanica]|nr:hypothetical protein IF2G_00686 [Cordyceps javanica]